MEAERTPERLLRIDADGVDLCGLRFGDDSGRGLLLTHGLGQTAGAWRRSARRMAIAGWTAIAADARGHGRSGRNPPGLSYTPEQLVDDLRRWSDEFERKPVLIGASMGGLMGLIAQARYACFSALVLVDITPRWESDGVARILAFMRAHGEGFASIDEAIGAIADYMPHRPRKTAQALSGLLEQDEDGRWRWHWDPRLVEDMNADIERRQAQLSEAAAQIRAPVLLLTGAASDVVSTSTIDEFLRQVPHARHQQIAEARHLIAGDDNDAFAQAVLEFIQPLALGQAA